MNDQLCAARVGEDLVLLDVAGGDYELVPGLFRDGSPADPEALAGAIGVEAASHLDTWFSAGCPAPSLPGPQRGISGEPATATSRDLVDFWSAWIGLGPGYLYRPFADLLRTPKAGTATVLDEAALQRRCASFESLSAWAPFQGVCLYRAFFLRTFLARGGHAPRWVFGVRTWPFRAHCWLQQGDLVLNDDPERVRLFTAILVV